VEGKTKKLWGSHKEKRSVNISKLLCILTIFLVAVSLLKSPLWSITSEQLALQVEKRYRSLATLSMDFVRITRSDIFETESRTEGKMILKNPDKFKIQTEEETIVCDGEFVWSYSVENQQVLKNEVERSQSLFKPNEYLSNFQAEYVPQLAGEEKVDGTGCYKLSLSPKKEEVFIKKMNIWVDKKSHLARKLEYTDANENEITLIFHHIDTNRKIKDSEFVFQTPPGVEEVDLSE
jgi:outer membrane lipoprotein-sorting protein